MVETRATSAWRPVLTTFAVTATVVLAFLAAAELFHFNGTWLWLAVALPASPFGIILQAFRLPEPIHFALSFAFPAVFWGLISAGVAFLVKRQGDRMRGGG